MIRITIAAVGKCDGIYRGAAEEYVKRMNRFAKVEIAECRECASGGSEKEIAAAKKKEGEELLSRAKGYLIALDKGGEEMGSAAFADFLDKTASSGASQFTFVIGGSEGLSDEVLSAADKVLSFGKMTLPHQLARLVLAEQIYRALTIWNHVAYHK